MQSATITEMRRPASAAGRPWLVVSVVFCAALAYIFVRYHYFGNTPWERAPLFTMNKVVSFAAALLFAWVHLVRPAPPAGVKIGLAAFWLAALHVLMSMALLMPDHYAKLYEGAAYNLTGQTTLLFGCLTVMLLALPAVASIPSVREALTSGQRLFARRAGYAALFFIALHVFALGIAGWLRPSTWTGGLPSPTLLTFLAVLAPLAAMPFRKRE
jgi:hypothetical protein